LWRGLQFIIICIFVAIVADTDKHSKTETSTDSMKNVPIILGCFAVLSGIGIAIYIAIRWKGT